MNPETLGLIRHTLTSVGGGLVTKGIIGSDDLQGAAGALAIIIGVVWSIIHKGQVQNQINNAALTGNSKP